MTFVRNVGAADLHAALSTTEIGAGATIFSNEKTTAEEVRYILLFFYRYARKNNRKNPSVK